MRFAEASNELGDWNGMLRKLFTIQQIFSRFHEFHCKDINIKHFYLKVRNIAVLPISSNVYFAWAFHWKFLFGRMF